MYRSMMQIYIKNSEQALEFYQNAFNAKLICDHRHENGSVAHAELDIYGQIFAICELQDNNAVTGNIMQFCLHFGEGKEETVKRAYDILKADCLKLIAPITKPGECPWSPCLFGVIDKFGVNWCVFV
ncbi:MAG: VOC family protein [Oscillospiraceae bacterium]|nr:VOC family protein [Oscillospiraceae bacterium]